MSLGILFAVFLVLLFIGTPIGATLGVSAMMPDFYQFLSTGNFAGFSSSLQMMVRTLFSGVDSFPLLAIPMFILSGVLMARGGVSEKMFNVFSFFLANKTGGMPAAVVISCLFYGTISGSGPATTAAVGAMTIPMMTSLGYDLKFSVSLVAVAGGLGVIIPPSIPFILIGSATGTSISDLFLAGIIPSFLISALMIAYGYVYCKIKGEDKEKLTAHHQKLKEIGIWKLFKSSFWALLSPVIILGSIYGGIASPTEAAVISVIYGLIISLFVYRTLKLKDLKNIFLEAVNTYSTLLFVLAAAVAFGRTLTFMRAPQAIAEMMTGTFESPLVILIIMHAMLLFIGMFMDTTPAVLIMSPLLLPVAVSIGIHPVHFGVMFVVNKAIGFITPPLGINLFVASSMSGVPIMQLAKKAVPMLLIMFVALALITGVSWFSLALLS